MRSRSNLTASTAQSCWLMRVSRVKWRHWNILALWILKNLTETLFSRRLKSMVFDLDVPSWWRPRAFLLYKGFILHTSCSADIWCKWVKTNHLVLPDQNSFLECNVNVFWTFNIIRDSLYDYFFFVSAKCFILNSHSHLWAHVDIFILYNVALQGRHGWQGPQGPGLA